MKQTSQNSHNLNLAMYSFREILDLFNLTYDITDQDLKAAKKQVLMMHPDKSRMPPEYFLFYKKAFDEVVKYYIQQNRENQIVGDQPIEYLPSSNNVLHSINDEHSNFEKQIKSKITEMVSQDTFNKTFNEMFEQSIGGGIEHAVKDARSDKNKWFSEEDPVFLTEQNVTKDNINSAINKIKEQQQQQALIKYGGVRELNAHFAGDFLYGDDSATAADNTQYISCDPFQSLKYDDIQKVHKDQTVFSVSENDFQKMKTFQNIEEAKRFRHQDGETLKPLEKAEAELLLNQKQQIYLQSIAEKQHKTELKTEDFITKTKEVLSRFFLLK